MRMIVCCVFDAAVNAYLPPFFVRSRGEAVRAFQKECANAQSPFHQHPGDFRLCVLGVWDDGNALFVDCGLPEPLMSARDAVPSVPE